jgi:MFS family permease
MTRAQMRPDGGEGTELGGGRHPAGLPAAPGPRRPGNPYLEVLRLPGAFRFSFAGFLARMPISMFALGTVLLIAALTGRYGLAGAVAAAGSVGYAVAAPQLGKLTDRFGQRRVLLPQVMVFGVASAALMTLAETRAPLVLVAAAGMIAGATMPSIGSMVRSRWSGLLAGSPRLHTAFSLESVVDEIIFVVGPVLVTLLATDVYPAAGVAAATVLCVTGTLLLAAQRGTEPPPRPRAARGSPGTGSGPGDHPPVPPALMALVPVYLLMGTMFSAIELSTVAFASQRGHRAAAGLVLGVYALGSAVGGLWYGSRHWRAPLAGRFAVTLGGMTAGVAMFWWQPGLSTLFPVIFAAGLAIAPTLITGYSLIEHLAPPERKTEGMTWLSSAIAVGGAAGAPLAGHVIDAHGARWGYVLAAACGGAAFAVCLAGLTWLRGPAPAAAPAPR